jgi:hypothetical protein
MATRGTKSNAPSQAQSQAATITAEAAAGAAPGLDAPTRVTPEELHELVHGPQPISSPALMPPDLREIDSPTESTLGAVTGTWRSAQYVDAMWSIDQVRNAWMLVRGLGWRKIYNGRDGAFDALAMLASQARQTGHQISFREEADGMAYEIYLW